MTEERLIAIVGRGSGRHLHALAHNRDPRPVQPGRRRRSMGAQRAIGRGPHRLADVDASLIGLVDRVTRRLRAADRVGRTVVLRLRFDDFERATRSQTLTTPTSETTPLLAAARALLADASPLIEERGITLVGVSITNLAVAGCDPADAAARWRPERGARRRPRPGARAVRDQLADARRAARP